METLHTSTGAISESFEKFIKPLKLNYEEDIAILDICAGLGYNSSAAIDDFIKNSDGTTNLHIDMINELEEIVKIPYIDGFIFGPNDLSGSLGEFLNVYGEKTMSQIKKAINVLRKHKKFIGLAGGMAPSDIKTWSELDLDMLFAGADWNFVYQAGKETLNNLQNFYK